MSLFSEETRRDPYPMYEAIRGGSAVLHYPPTDTYMLFDYEGVKRALTDHQSFSSAVSEPAPTPSNEVRCDPSQWLIFQDPPRHNKLRALIARAFTARSIAALEPRIHALTRELLSRHPNEMDLVEDFAMPLPLIVIAEMFGLPISDYPRFRQWSDVILALSLTVSGGDEALRAQAAYRDLTSEMGSYLDDLIAKRRVEPRDDLLTRLLQAEVDGERLSDHELLGFFQLLLIAGHETTTNLISNTVLTLLEHPSELERIRKTPDLLRSAIEEVLRFRSPVQATFRKTTCEVEIHGQVIPAGKLVVANIGAANRDPKQFADPDRFDITRDPNPHIAFGHGIHFCVGAPLSRLEARVALPHLLRLPSLRRANNDPWEPRQAFHVLGPARLPVCFESK